MMNGRSYKAYSQEHMKHVANNFRVNSHCTASFVFSALSSHLLLSRKMHLLPLLLLLAGARVEGGRETGGVEELQMDRQVVWVTQQEKDNLEEEKLPKAQGKMKDTNCSQLLESFSESSSNFTRCLILRKNLFDAFSRCANQYAKPIFMCRNCLEDYLTVIEIYEALEHR